MNTNSESVYFPPFIDITANEYIEENDSDDDDFVNQNALLTFNNCETKKQIQLIPSQNKHLWVSNGFNLSGKCAAKINKNCVGKNGVWIMLGYGTFNIAKIVTKQKCPACSQKIQSSTLKSFGYKKAKVTFSGTRVVNGEDEDFEKESESNGDLFTLHSDADDAMSQWRYLQITVQKK